MTPEAWKAHLDAYREEADAAHKRLRRDLSEVEVNQIALTARIAAINATLKQPIAAERVSLSGRFLLLFLGSLVTIIVTIYSAKASIQSQVQTLADQLSTEQKLQQLRNDTLMTALSDLKRQQQLDDYNIQDLQKAVNTLQKGLR